MIRAHSSLLVYILPEVNQYVTTMFNASHYKLWTKEFFVNPRNFLPQIQKIIPDAQNKTVNAMFTKIGCRNPLFSAHGVKNLLRTAISSLQRAAS